MRHRTGVSPASTGAGLYRRQAATEPCENCVSALRVTIPDATRFIAKKADAARDMSSKMHNEHRDEDRAAPSASKTQPTAPANRRATRLAGLRAPGGGGRRHRRLRPHHRGDLEAIQPRQLDQRHQSSGRRRIGRTREVGKQGGGRAVPADPTAAPAFCRRPLRLRPTKSPVPVRPNGAAGRWHAESASPLRNAAAQLAQSAPPSRPQRSVACSTPRSQCRVAPPGGRLRRPADGATLHRSRSASGWEQAPFRFAPTGQSHSFARIDCRDQCVGS
jgi:hypothetical protein